MKTLHGPRPLRVAGWLMLLAGLAVFTAPLSAQRRADREAGTGLDRVEELTRLGRTEEARAALTQWWESDAADASRRDVQRGLWLRGRLTVDPVQAGLDFQRLVVLYPSGTYTPDALLRLLQAAHARGDEESVQRYVDALARDHPNDAVREDAEDWLRAAGPPDPVEVRAGGGAGPRGPGATEPADGLAPDAPRRGERPGRGAMGARGADARAEFSVQLGAFADANRALALLEEVRDAGVDARLVRVDGSRFLHVRVGRFAERPTAAAQLEALARVGFSAAIVRDERAERAVRRAGGS